MSSITIRERKAGVWTVRVETRDAAGKRAFQYATVKGSRKDADAERSRLMVALATTPGEAPAAVSNVLAGPTPLDTLTVAAWAERWLDTQRTMGVYKPQALRSVTRFCDYMTMAWGPKRIAGLTRTDVLTGFMALAKRGLGPDRLHSTATYVRRVLSDAAAAGARVDMTLWQDLPLPKRQKSAGVVLTDADRAKVLAHVAKHRLGVLVRFALATGARRQEIVALEWRDINWRASQVTVSRAAFIDDDRVQRIGTPKTESSRRSVKVPASILAELREMRARDESAVLATGGAASEVEDMAVFRTQHGHRWCLDGLSAVVSEVLAAAGYPGVTLHDLRHMHATALLRAKQSPRAVQRRMGHSDISVTLGIYGHVMQDDDDALAEQMERIVNG
jgi:integrase